jgi:hypothetical protein
MGSFAMRELLNPKPEVQSPKWFRFKGRMKKEECRKPTSQRTVLRERFCILHSTFCISSRRRALNEFDLQGNARLGFATQPDVHRIQTRRGKLQLLDVHDKIE